MRALRRATRQDVRDSNIVYQLAIQTHMAEQAGEITPEMRLALLNVFQRTHTYICANSGVLARNRMRYFDRRNKSTFKWDSEALFALTCLAAFGVALAAAWLIAR